MAEMLLRMPVAQIFNLFLPRVNVRRTSAWYKESEAPDFSPSDSQVPPSAQRLFWLSYPLRLASGASCVCSLLYPVYCLFPDVSEVLKR